MSVLLSKPDFTLLVQQATDAQLVDIYIKETNAERRSRAKIAGDELARRERAEYYQPQRGE